MRIIAFLIPLHIFLCNRMFWINHRSNSSSCIVENGGNTIAEQNENRLFLRLRDFEDLKRWIQGEFWSLEEWREIPNEITLAPGRPIPCSCALLTNTCIDRAAADQHSSGMNRKNRALRAAAWCDNTCR